MRFFLWVGNVLNVVVARLRFLLPKMGRIEVYLAEMVVIGL